MNANLMIVGAAIFGLLGLVHLIYTYFGKRLHPTATEARSAMENSHLNLTRETTVWRAWIGFNASHSVGAILFAVIYIQLAIYHWPVIEGSAWFTWLPVLVGSCYSMMAKRYWFRVPFFGILIASVCFLIAASRITFLQ